MSEETKKEDKVVERRETRTFRYTSEVTFEFDVDVSKPETAVAEITDFIELMKSATSDLEAVRKEFAAKLEKPKETEKPAVEPG